MTRDEKKLHLFGHLLRNNIAEIIVKIARKIEKLHGVLAISCFLKSLFSCKKVRKRIFF